MSVINKRYVNFSEGGVTILFLVNHCMLCKSLPLNTFLYFLFKLFVIKQNYLPEFSDKIVGKGQDEVPHGWISCSPPPMKDATST